jgi:hypothetical protein
MLRLEAHGDGTCKSAGSDAMQEVLQRMMQRRKKRRAGFGAIGKTPGKFPEQKKQAPRGFAWLEKKTPCAGSRRR